MSVYHTLAAAIAAPFAGTSLGAAVVLFMNKKAPEKKLGRALLGLAAGVMTAASVWSLLLPSIEMAGSSGGPPWLPAFAGFFAGVSFLFICDRFVPAQHNSRSGALTDNKREASRLMLAVTLHNIPEGMAVGIVSAGLLAGESGITAAGVTALALGITVQNFPEGAIISLPLRGEGSGKFKAFAAGVLSGAVEPVAALASLIFTAYAKPVMPYLLSFAAGAMVYVVADELIPESQNGGGHGATLSFAAGFALMMVLDVALG